MFGYKELSDALNEFANVSVAIAGYESPAKPMKKEKKPKEGNKRLNGLINQMGDS